MAVHDGVDGAAGGYAHNKEQGAFTAFERLFKERGLPLAIRSDNGVPFASPNGLFNLSRLAVWWLRLGLPSSAAWLSSTERPP